ncbi:MAG: hypothetical protein FWG10_08485 [Eubacteriaceae bacterium]|nr:hypothetical protein [Eubacteriaceae bacterium]
MKKSLVFVMLALSLLLFAAGCSSPTKALNYDVAGLWYTDSANESDILSIKEDGTYTSARLLGNGKLAIDGGQIDFVGLDTRRFSIIKVEGDEYVLKGETFNYFRSPEKAEEVLDMYKINLAKERQFYIDNIKTILEKGEWSSPDDSSKLVFSEKSYECVYKTSSSSMSNTYEYVIDNVTGDEDAPGVFTIEWTYSKGSLFTLPASIEFAVTQENFILSSGVFPFSTEYYKPVDLRYEP